ncbi:MAG: hypothetical protein M3O46_05050 [Myxococcota bacterium]|nr:hypothetical protein [Myxococcota bacterium]
MRARLIAGGALASAFVAGAIAFAQPRAGHSPPHPSSRPHATAPDNASAASAGFPATPPGPGDAGPVQPLPFDLGDGSAKLSPLNPAANEFSDAGLTTTSIDYDRLLADLASLRARAAAVSDVLFHSRMVIALQTSGDHVRIASLSVALDDGTVWTSAAAFRADDATIVYDHAVAPGHHAVTIQVERRDDRDETFRSSQRSRFVVDVPADARLRDDLHLSDDSTMGGDFISEKKGQYDLRVRAQAKAQPL